MSKYFFIWIIIAVFFLAAEIAHGSRYFVFFSIASVLVALCTLAGLAQVDLQVLAFFSLGAISVVLFRRKLQTSLFHMNHEQVPGDL